MNYFPDPLEEIQTNLRKIIRELYNEFSMDHRTRMAFKGGHLNLPYLDLEVQLNFLRDIYDELWNTCAWHAIPALHHCAMTECQAFLPGIVIT